MSQSNSKEKATKKNFRFGRCLLNKDVKYTWVENKINPFTQVFIYECNPAARDFVVKDPSSSIDFHFKISEFPVAAGKKNPPNTRRPF